MYSEIWQDDLIHFRMTLPKRLTLAIRNLLSMLCCCCFFLVFFNWFRHKFCSLRWSDAKKAHSLRKTSIDCIMILKMRWNATKWKKNTLLATSSRRHFTKYRILMVHLYGHTQFNLNIENRSVSITRSLSTDSRTCFIRSSRSREKFFEFNHHPIRSDQQQQQQQKRTTPRIKQE